MKYTSREARGFGVRWRRSVTVLPHPSPRPLGEGESLAAPRAIHLPLWLRQRQRWIYSCPSVVQPGF